MSFAATVPAAVLETILARLAALFLTGANGDPAAARLAAVRMLCAYRPETEDELGVAASIIGFTFQALEALAQAAAPDLPITRILRLRGSAVSLSRESTKAQRRLDQLQKVRRQGDVQQEMPTQHVQTDPRRQPAPVSTKDAGYFMASPKTGREPRPQTEEDRQREQRILASLKRAELKFGLKPDPALAAIMPGQHTETGNQATSRPG